VAISSHIVLDLATHIQDIAVAPGFDSIKFGSGLYAVPLLALTLETLYGITCWWLFGGSKKLLAVIILLNLAALSFYSPFILGSEQFLTGQPKIFAAAIGVHIIVGLFAIGLFARTRWNDADKLEEGNLNQSAISSCTFPHSRPTQVRGGNST